jgi:hypothetical protein
MPRQSVPHWVPKPFGPSDTLRANKVAPRAAVFENGMGDADKLLFVTEGDDAMPVLEPDYPRGPQTRRGKAHQFIEEDAAVCVAPAFRHEGYASPAPRAELARRLHAGQT